MATVTPRAGSPELTASSTSDSTSFTVPLAPHDVGDYLVVILSADGNPTISCPGWTVVRQQNNSTNNKLIIFQRDTVAASSSETDPVFTSDGAQQYAAAAYSFPATVFNIDTATATGLDGAGNPPLLAPSEGSQDYLFIAALSVNDGAVGLSAYPSGYTNTGYIGNGGSGGVLVAVCEKAVTGSSDNPGTYTHGSRHWAAITAAVWGTPAEEEGGGGETSTSRPSIMMLMGV